MQRLSMAMCPACERVNPFEAMFCNACGTPLVRRCQACDTINVRTRAACHHCGAALETIPSPGEAPAGAAHVELVTPLLLQDTVSDLPDIALPEIDWSLSLRELPKKPDAGPPADAAASPVEDTVPGFLVADRDAPSMADAALPIIEPAPAVSPPAAAPSSPAPKDSPAPGPGKNAEKALAKARRRATVRRARLLADGPAPALPRDVLVLEVDGEARASLCQLLELFGFRPHMAVSVAEAEGLSARTDHAAVFLGMSGSDSAAAAELCRHLIERPKNRPKAVIGVGDAKRHTDRVRMELAGAHAVLTRPVHRGDLARVLDDCGLPLPQDPRHGAPPDL